jgi:exodeoxyribonuclease VIII
MAADRYHGIAAMSASGLKLMKQSPAHFYGRNLDPDRPPPATVEAFALGTLFHTCLFEPDSVHLRYVVKPEGHDGRTKEGKAWLAENAGLEVVAADKMAAAWNMARSARTIPDVSALMREGYAESSAFWVDEATGELCKCRPDWTSPASDGVILLDGKSCQDASVDGFARAIWNYGYHNQAAWYSDGFECATGKRVHGFVFVAVETTYPHVAAAYMLGDDLLDKARAENRRLLDLYAQCKRENKWPGYAGGIELIHLPVWAERKLEQA